jgi:hypothetical protein
MNLASKQAISSAMFVTTIRTSIHGDVSEQSGPDAASHASRWALAQQDRDGGKTLYIDILQDFIVQPMATS